MTTPPDYGATGERKLRAFVETLMGTPIVRMERQVRWRPAWFVDVELNGQLLHLHLRGDREGDVAIFPDLQREADVMRVLGAHGIQVPRIYGYCQDPPCIVMDALPGSRNMDHASDDATRRSIARAYMAEVAAMHRLPVAPFAELGMRVPEGAQAIALVGLEAYTPLYQRTKSRPEPFLEFVLGWIRRNVPQHRTQAAFIQFDSGQFHHHQGKLSGLYDFEFSMVGDPMVDIATMRMRNSVEPLGDDLRTLCRHYEEFSGQAVDHAVVDFHTLLFATLGAMQFTGTVARPRPGDAHAVYLEFDLALRQVMLLAMRDLTGVTLPSEPPLVERVGHNVALLEKIADTVARIETPDQQNQSRKDTATQLIEWMLRSDALGAEVRARDLADVAVLLGCNFAEWAQAEAALEEFVRMAEPAMDGRLLQLFHVMEARRMHLFGKTKIGHSASHVAMPATR